MVVLDTSIIFKWLREEDTRHLSLELLDRFISGKEKVIVPDLLLYELANALSSKTELTLSDIQVAWNLFTEFNVPVYVPTTNFLKKCLKFAKKYKVTVYDASFAMLAHEKKCDLITSDSEFAEQVNLPFVKSLAHYKKAD